MPSRWSALHVASLLLILTPPLAPTRARAQAQDAAPPAAEPATAAPPTPAAPPAAEPAAGEKKVVEESILVTGSRIRRKDLTTPAPVAVLTREDFQASGKVTIGEFLQAMPEQGNAPNFQVNNGGVTYDADGGTRINLRSLGVTRTLVLVNGRRMPASGFGTNSATPDLNTIPTAAVERIEVLKDGASAIYGSDAIGGVVNVITRRNYDATQASAQAGVSQRGDAQTYSVEMTTGRTTENGGLLFSVGYFDQKSSWLRDRSWSANALTYDYSTRTTFPGGSSRTPEGTLTIPSALGHSAECQANPVCSYWVANDTTWDSDRFIRVLGQPANTPAGWKVMTSADTYNYASENYLTTPATRVQVFSTGDTRLGPVRGFYEMSYVQSQAQQNAAPTSFSTADYGLSLSKDSYYNPLGIDLPSAGRRLVEFGHRTYSQEMETFRVVTGLEGTFRGWTWDAALNYGKTGGTFTTAGAIRNSKVADALGPSFQLPSGQVVCGNKGPDNIAGTADDVIIPSCVPLNLFGGPNNGSIDPSQIDNLGFTGTSRARFQTLSATLNAAGELFYIAPDRPVALAVGYEHRTQSGAQIADPVAAAGDSQDFNFKSTRGSYDADEAFAEVQVPLLAGKRGFHVLEASAAARYVKFSTFGSNTSYKLGARWAPVPDLTVRGTYSTAFRAPSINELYLGLSDTAPNAKDPCNYDRATASPELVAQCRANGAPNPTGDNGTQEITHVGGNPDLKAETAKIATLGLVFEPRAVRGLTFTLDYYRTSVDNLVGTIGTAAIIQGCIPAGFNSTAAPYQPYCALIKRATSDGHILFVTDVNQNVGRLETGGIDLGARYDLPTSVGRFRFGVEGTWLQKFDRILDLATGKVVIHGKGTFDLGSMPEWKANFSAAWARAGWGAGGMLRYVGGFKECGAFSTDDGIYESTGGLCYADAAAPSRKVGAYAAIDLHGGYTHKSSAGTSSLTLGVNNVLDRKPEFVYAAPLANSDAQLYDFLGRYFYVRLGHNF